MAITNQISVSIAMPDGRRTISARGVRLANFVVFLDSDQTWNITHIHSGMRMTSDFKFLRAYDMAKILDQQTGWNALSLPPDDKLAPILKSQLIAAKVAAEKLDTQRFAKRMEVQLSIV